ncbi:hypothetical protein WLZ34_03955 [Thermogladius sp. KZ2Tp1]|uniref:hypothetical protein n=1 Tax=Thermogladius sp. KZ2Tp1 TaxID=3136289 RepID=UPI003DA8BCAE
MGTPTKELLRNAEGILEVLVDASRELTSEISSACRILHLPGVEVLLSLKEFREEESESTLIVCGRYDPVSRGILVSLPCLLRSGGNIADEFLETVSHELVHHCQFAGGPDNICEVKLSIKDAELLAKILPYDHRPHEIEAYSKQHELSELIKSYLGKSGELIMRVLRTLKNDVELEHPQRSFTPSSDTRDECSAGSLLFKTLENFEVNEVEVVVDPDLSKEPGEAQIYVLTDRGVAIKYLWREDSQKGIYMPLKPVSIRLPRGEYQIKHVKASYNFLETPRRSEDQDAKYNILKPAEVESYIINNTCRFEQKAIRAEDLISLILMISLGVYDSWPRNVDDVKEMLSRLSMTPRGDLIEIGFSVDSRGSYAKPQPVSILMCKDVKIQVDSDSVEVAAIVSNWPNYLNKLVEAVKEDVEVCKKFKLPEARIGNIFTSVEHELELEVTFPEKPNYKQG